MGQAKNIDHSAEVGKLIKTIPPTSGGAAMRHFRVAFLEGSFVPAFQEDNCCCGDGFACTYVAEAFTGLCLDVDGIKINAKKTCDAAFYLRLDRLKPRLLGVYD